LRSNSPDRMRGLIPTRLLVFLGVALGPLALVGKELVQGRVLFWGTPALQFVPWWAEGIRQVSQGSAPLWNALNGMGAPLLANYQTAFFYPPNWLLFFFNQGWGSAGIAWGFTFLAMLHLIWGGLGMAALLRRLNAGLLAQVVAGSAYALCGYWVGRMEFISMIYVGAWIPWLLRYVDDLASPVTRGPDATGQKWLHLPLVGVLAMMLLAGHAQLTWYTLEFCAVWVIAGALWSAGWRGLVKPLGRLASAGMVAGLLAAVQLLPTAEYLLQSQRASAVAYEKALVFSMWPWRLVSLLAPDFFGSPGSGNFWGYASYWEDHAYLSVLILLMALSSLGALVRQKNRQPGGWLPRRLAWLLWGILLVALLFAFGLYTPIYPFLYRFMPTFNMFQAPARMLVWAVIALILLGASGVDRWTYPSGKGLYWLRLGTAGAFAVALGAGLGWVFLRDVKLTSIQATALFGVWALGTGILGLLAGFKERPGWRIAWPVLVYAWVTLDLLVAGWNLNPTVTADFYGGSAETVKQVKSSLAGKRIFLSQTDEYFLKFGRFLRFRDYRAYEDWTGIRKVLLPNTNLLDGIPTVSNFDPFVPDRYATLVDVINRLPEERRAPAMQWMDVGAVEQVDGSALDGVRFEPVDGGFMAAFYSCVVPVSPGEHPLAQLARRGYSSMTLLVEVDLPIANSGCDGKPPQAVVPLSTVPGRLEIDPAGKSGWLFISQVWYPGWTATVDGAPAQVYRANYALSTVNVPAGAKKIILQYQPISFEVGGLLSILILIVLCILMLRRNWINRRGASLTGDPYHRSI